jgi:DNA polymerase I
VFEFIMNRDVDGAVNYRNELLNLVRKGDPSIDISKLVISRSVKRFGEHGQYKDEKSLANVRVAKKLMERGETFIPGMKVSWIVTNSRKTPQEVEPFIDGSPFTGKPDWDYYARRIEETLDRVLEGLAEDYGKSALSSQTKLMEFQEKRTANSSEEKKPKGQQSNLFEF